MTDSQQDRGKIMQWLILKSDVKLEFTMGIQKNAYWKDEQPPFNHDQNMNCKRENCELYCIHPAVKPAQFPLCSFRYEKIMTLCTFEKEVLEQVHTPWSWYSSHINCHYMDSKTSISPPEHLSFSSSQNTFVSFSLVAMHIFPSELCAKGKSNGELTFGSKIYGTMQWM